jgi:UDP-glucose 4-epimerase
MKILIVGATGFVGKNLLNSLITTKENSIICTSRSEISRIDRFGVRHEPYSLGDDFSDNIIKFSPEVIINLAWHGIPNFSYENSVININKHILFISKINQIKSVKKLIYTGSCVELEEKDTNLKISKGIVRSFLKLYCNEFDIKNYWLQIFYVYGPGQRSESIIPSLVRSYMNNEEVNIKNPESNCDYIYIEDVINVIKACINNVLEAADYQVGSGKNINISLLSEIAKSLVLNDEKCLSLIFKENNQKKIFSNFHADIQKIRMKIKNYPLITIDEGIKKYIKNL